MKIYVAALALFCAISASAQTLWDSTSSAASQDRYDDVFFLNKDTGWAASSSGEGIIRTYDGGANWQTLVNNNGLSYRDIAFLNAQLGFVGLLASVDTHKCLLKTIDGGVTWDTVDLPGPKQKRGICGMHVVNDSTICAVGRYPGPAGFYKTTDRGNTWTYTDMSPYARGLIDVFFFNTDTGFAAGTLNGFTNFSASTPDSCGVILYTTDGGNTWQVVAKTSRIRELCWKISFPSRNVGYVSIEAIYPGAQFYFKTTDGGLTWQEKSLPTFAGQQQGIGFINDSVGWIGGRDMHTYQTTNGGDTWVVCPVVRRVNRFRFISGKLAYAAGTKIYKLDLSCDSATTIETDTAIAPGASITLPSGNTVSTAGVYLDTISHPVSCDTVFKTTVSVVSNIPHQSVLENDIQVYPNPAKNQLNIEWNDVGLTFNDAELININGQLLPITILQSAQRLTLNWNNDTPKGVYTLKLKSAEGKEVTRKVVIL